MGFRTALLGDKRSFVALSLCLLFWCASAHAEAAPSGTAVLSKKTLTAAEAHAAKAQVDRLTILTQEYNSNSAELTQELAKKSPDPANVARLKSNLAAIAKEIDSAKRNPVPPLSMNPPAARPAQQVTASAPKVAAPQSDPQDDEGDTPKVVYETWDIFQNFGRKKDGKP